VSYENSRPDGRSGNTSPSILSCELATVDSPDPADFNCFDPLGGALGGVIRHAIKTEYINRAVYAQASYDILEQLRVTGGLRYTWDETRGSNLREIYRFIGSEPQQRTLVDSRAKQESEAPTGLLELQYRPLADVMLYAKYVRGYRQGGVNMAADDGVNTHDKETVDTFEIGAKTEFHWPIPGRFNIAVFDNDFTDMQLQTGYVSPTAGPTTAIFNAGSSRIRGVEFDGFLQLLERLTASCSFTYLDTELEEQDQEGNVERLEEAGGPLAGLTFTPIADEGDELPFAADLSYTVSINYRLPLPPAIGSVSVGATYARTGKQRATASSVSPNDMIEAYSVLNLNMRWQDMLGLPLDLSVFATNVRDEEYVTYLSGTFSSQGYDSRTVGMPKMYGARLRYSF
jgi:iron complex outermembrane recepter protein